MALATTPVIVDPAADRSAVSWGAILAGAVVASAVTILLFILGSGIGLSSVSPWQNSGASASTVTKGAVVWLIIVQWISALFGGYIAGRLRTKWTGIHSDEAFFRDTAHGLGAWAVATLLTVFVATSALTGIAGSAARTVGSVAGSAVQATAQAGGAAASSDAASVYVDRLFRSAQAPATDNAAARAEVGRILTNSLASGSLSDQDRSYLVQLVAARAGISPEDAQKRVDDAVASMKAAADKAKEAAEEARKAAAKLSFYTFFSMLVGAFIACTAGALGGRLRDET
jgi:hypothetical protein